MPSIVLVLLGAALFHLALSPYSKVEESFNMQVRNFVVVMMQMMTTRAGAA